MDNYILLILFTATLAAVSDADYDGLVKSKIWTANTNFDNPENWNLNRVPCSKDTVIFKDEVAVLMPKGSLGFREIILPRTGELILNGDGTVLTADGENSKGESCDGQEATFLGSKIHDWFDPSNWNVTLDDEVYMGAGLSPIPHSDVIPCDFDKVVFPGDTSFKVQLDTQLVIIGKLVINNKEFTTQEFSEVLRTSDGKQLFDTTAEIRIGSTKCTDPTGCVCRNRDQELFKICIRQERRCPELKCLDPIQPIGHCCQICGSVLKMDYKEGFQMERLRSVLKKYMNKNDYQGTKTYLSKMQPVNGQGVKIQIVFIDINGQHHKAAKMASDLHQYLIGGSSGAKMLNLKNIQLEASRLYIDTNLNRGMGAGGIIGILILILLLVGSLVAGYIYFQKRRIPGFAFARFDLGGKIELEVGTTSHSELEPPIPLEPPTGSPDINVGSGFDNPMFDTPQQTHTAFEGPKKQVTEEYTSIENPMFMTFEDESPLQGKN